MDEETVDVEVDATALISVNPSPAIISRGPEVVSWGLKVDVDVDVDGEEGEGDGEGDGGGCGALSFRCRRASDSSSVRWRFRLGTSRALITATYRRDGRGRDGTAEKDW